MGFRGNNVLHKNHFRKDWQRRVKTWFDQPGAKKRRRNARQAKAAAAGVRPTSLLRPAVRCQTVRYNRRIRAGRGFTSAELAAAGIRRKEALSIGVPYDHRRRNKSEEGVSCNVDRLKAYKERLIIFPKNAKKPGKADSTVRFSEVLNSIYTLTNTSTISPLLQDLSAATTQDISGPLPLPSGTKPEAPRAITSEELEFNAFRALRQARAAQRQAGVWKARKQKKEEEDAAKKK
ncbi:60S ribosomal protein L13 [Puccinia graminis f. sp. tritici]|uniref:60S ribosomal protein L13 n=1 Tax=Puccinia graminis f. sp. tritici TaxID=56615 RepID=A0A5B0RDH9_PUCGR|nr:60S ribosomal protein L13 [Puccinia graminis f. sp. tritici]